MEVIILAGGMGKRLRKSVPDIPKPMAPVNDKPFLFYLLKWLKKYHVEKIVLSTGYKHESLFEYFGNLFENIPLIYIREEKPLGTGGAVVKTIVETTGSDILIVNGDTWFPINLEMFYDTHSDHNNIITIALKRMEDFSRYGTVEIIGDMVMKFHEKKFCSHGYINGGIYLFNRKYFRSREFPEVFSLEEEILSKEAGTSALKAIVYDDPFLDIGIPEDYYKAGNILKNS